VSKHTPGPWESYSHLAGRWHKVKGPPQLRLPKSEGGYICFANEADALLIAAAPDLLEALRGALALLQEAGCAYMPGDAAIARAEGTVT